MVLEKADGHTELLPQKEVDLTRLVAVFDLDGTLVKGTFEDTVKQFVLDLSQLVDEDLIVEEVCDRWKNIQDLFRDLLQVDPILAVMATQIIMEEYGVSQNDDEGRKLMTNLCRGIYHSETVELCPGTMKAVEKFSKVRMMIGTIAYRGWTEYKLKKSGLEQFFLQDNVFCFNVRQRKADQWVDFFEHYGLKPEEVFVVGDSYESDVLPMVELGVKIVFWVNNGQLTEEEFWGGDVPASVVRLATVGDLVGYL